MVVALTESTLALRSLDGGWNRTRWEALPDTTL